MGCKNPIAVRRKELGLSQAALAKKLGVRRESVKDWERGVKYPSGPHLAALKDALCLSEDELWRVQHFRPKPKTAIPIRRDPIW